MKHGVIMVFSLILALCLIGVVSANENVTDVCEDSEIYAEDIQFASIDMQENEYDSDLSENKIIYSQYTKENEYDISCIIDSNPKLNMEHGNLEINTNNISVETFKLTKINDITEKNVLNINSPNGYVTYNDGNLLMLPLIERNMTDESLINNENRTEKILFSSNDGFSANLWNDDSLITGISSSNTLNKEPLNTGFISNQNNYNIYPQIDLPLGHASDTILGVSRDFDDNAFIWSKRSGEEAYLTVDMVNKSTDEVLDLSLNENVIKEIGINASIKALNYFKSQGINIQKGYPYLYVLTSASEVKLNNTSTESAIDGISEVLGLELNKNIFPIHNPLWQDLIFYYLWVNSIDNTDICSYALVYDSELSVSNDIKKQGDDMAYKMGLYKKHFPPKNNYYNNIGKKMINRFIYETNVNSTDTTNKTDDNINATVVGNYKENIPNSIAFSGNPFNLVYTAIAIIILLGIFVAGYSRRNM